MITSADFCARIPVHLARTYKMGSSSALMRRAPATSARASQATLERIGQWHGGQPFWPNGDVFRCAIEQPRRVEFRHDWLPEISKSRSIVHLSKGAKLALSQLRPLANDTQAVDAVAMPPHLYILLAG